MQGRGTKRALGKVGASLGLWPAIGLAAGLGGCKGDDDGPPPVEIVGDGFPGGLAVSAPLVAAPEGSVDALRAIEFTDLLQTSESCTLDFEYPTAESPDCFGPALDFENHPDATTGHEQNGSIGADVLALWAEREGESQACATAKVNALTVDATSKIDEALSLLAAMRCLMRQEAIALPLQVTLSINISESLAALLDDIDGAPSLSQASVTLEALDESVGTYRYRLVFERNNESVSVNIWHRDDSASLYVGRVSVEILTSIEPRYLGYSMDYERTETAVNYALSSADFGLATTTLFTSEGTLDFTQPWGSDAALLRVSRSLDDDRMNASLAWQGAPAESYSRAFNILVDPSASEPRACAFLGFGTAFDSDGATPSGTIDAFVCNATGPGADLNGVALHAQKQCMTSDAQGLWIPNESQISYGPVNDCDTSGDGFLHKFSTDTNFTNMLLIDELADLSSDADFAQYTAPATPAAIQ